MLFYYSRKLLLGRLQFFYDLGEVVPASYHTKKRRIVKMLLKILLFTVLAIFPSLGGLQELTIDNIFEITIVNGYGGNEQLEN